MKIIYDCPEIIFLVSKIWFILTSHKELGNTINIKYNDFLKLLSSILKKFPFKITLYYLVKLD